MAKTQEKLHASCRQMRRLIVLTAVFFLTHLSPVGAQITVIDDFTDGFFEETLLPGERLNQRQTDLSGVLGGQRWFRVSDIRANPGPGSVTVGILDRDNGVASVSSDIYIEALSLTYENLSLDLTKPEFSVFNIDLNIRSLAANSPVSFDVRVYFVDSQLDSATYYALVQESGQHDLSTDFAGLFVDDGFDPSDVEAISVSLGGAFNGEVAYDIDRIYFVPEPRSGPVLLGVFLLVLGSVRRHA